VIAPFVGKLSIPKQGVNNLERCDPKKPNKHPQKKLEDDPIRYNSQV